MAGVIAAVFLALALVDCGASEDDLTDHSGHPALIN
jgi:hypothetical protein